jgi:hypothetical protein
MKRPGPAKSFKNAELDPATLDFWLIPWPQDHYSSAVAVDFLCVLVFSHAIFAWGKGR